MAETIEMQVGALRDQVRQLERVVAGLSARAASPFLSRDDAAAYLRCSTKTIDEMIGRGQLPRRRLGARVLIPRDALESCLTP